MDLLTATNSLNDRIDYFKKNVTSAQIDTWIGLTIFVLIVSLFIFGYFWKNMFILKVIIVIGIIFVGALFAAKRFWFPFEEPKEVKQNSKPDESKPKIEPETKEPSMFEAMQDIVPDYDTFMKNSEKSMSLGI